MPDSAPLATATLTPKVEELRVTTGPFPASRKVYAAGRLHSGISVAMREIDLEASAGEPAVRVYDTSGPYSDPAVETDINQGLTLGTVDIIYTGQLFAGRTFGPLAIGGAPFMFRDFDHWKRFRDSPLFRELADGYEKKSGGNHVSALTYYGERLDDRCFAGSRIANQNRIVFRLTQQRLNDGADLQISSYDRHQVALARRFRDIIPEPLEHGPAASLLVLRIQHLRYCRSGFATLAKGVECEPSLPEAFPKRLIAVFDRGC